MVKNQAIFTGVSLSNASGMISNRIRKIMAPAANPIRIVIIGLKNQDAKLAGTAAMGCGRLVKKAVEGWLRRLPKNTY